MSPASDVLRNNEAARQIERRGFLQGGLSLGALTLLTGCDVTHTDQMQAVLNGMSTPFLAGPLRPESSDSPDREHDQPRTAGPFS